MKKRWLRFVVAAFVLAAGILVLIAILLQTSLVKHFAFEQLRTYLRIRSGIDLQATGVHLDFFRGTARLENLTIRSVSARDLPPVFKATQVDVRLSIPDAIRGFWAVEELNLNAPQIHIYVAQNGQTNLPKSAATSGPIPDFLIAHAAATNGSFRFQDLQQGISSLLPLWQLSVNGNRQTLSHHIFFASQQESGFEFGTYKFPIDSLEFSGSLRKTDIQIDLAQIAAAGSRLTMTGSLNDFSRLFMNLQLSPNLDLSRIAHIVGLKEEIQGRVSGTILVSGRLDDIQIEAQLKGSDIGALDYKRAGLDLRTRAEWQRDSGKLTVHAFDLASPQGSLSCSAELFPGSKPGLNSIDARVRNFDLFPVWKGLKPPFDLASKGTGSVSVQWEGEFIPSNITSEAHLDLLAARAAPGPYVLPISGTLEARMQSDRVVAKIQSFSVFGARVSGQFALRSLRDVEGAFQGDAPDIDALIVQLSQFLGKPDHSLLGMRMEGPLQFNAQVSGRLKQPNIVASIDTPALQASGIKDLNVKTAATIQGSQISFQNTIVLPQNSTVFAKGNLELGGRKPVLNLDAYTVQMQAASIPPILDSGIPAAGTLKATLHMNGETDNLSGNASVTGDELSLYGRSMGHLDMNLLLSGGEIRSTQFKLLRNRLNPDVDYLEGQFAYALDSGKFQFQANGKELALHGLISSGGDPVQGTMTLLASGAGTIEQPSIDIRLESSNIQVWKKPLGPVSVNGALKDGQVKLDVLAPKLNIASTTLVVDRNPYPFKGDLRLKDSDLSLLGLKGANGQPLTGTIDATLTGEGDVKNLAQAQISARIQSMHLQSGGLEVHTRNPVQMEYRDNSLDISSGATLVSGSSILEISGRVPIRQPAPEGTLRLKGQIDLAQATEFMPIPKGFAAAGILNLNFALAGSTQKLSSEGAITLKDGLVQLPQIPTPLTDITLQANIQDGSLVLQQASAAWGQGRIALTGELPFGLLPRTIPVQFPRKEGPAHFTLDMTNLRPEATGMLPQGFGGLISLHATGQTTKPDLRALSARIVFRDLNLSVNDIGFSQKDPSTIVVHDGIALVSRLSLTGTQTSIDVGGSVGLLPNGRLDLRLVGNLDAALLTVMSQDLKAAGKLQVQVVAAGNRNAPILSGLAAMSGGRLSLRSPRIVADSLTMRLNFSPNRIAVQEFRGTLNGGSVTVDGTIGYQRGTLSDFNLKATMQDFFLNFPEGLKSVSSGNLAITSSDHSIVVSGSIRALESSFREPFVVGSQLMDYLRTRQVVAMGQERSPLLERIRLDIAVRTATPLLVQNNIAKVEASSNLRIVGTFYEPSIVGRVTLNEGGAIILNQQQYYITRGSITLTNQNYIEPELNIEAQTRVDIYDITLHLTGIPERLTTSLTSEPPESEANILALLLTGKLASETQNPGLVRSQALSLLAGQAGEEVTREARQALHLSTFRIDPGLIASESDPGARLTLGEDITRNLNLAYSMNLVNGGDQIWAAQYNVTRGFTTQATKQQDNSYRFEFRHDVRLGGPSSNRPSRSAAQKFKIGSIQFQGGGPTSDKTLLDKLKVKSGDKYDFPKIQKGLDRLHDFYADQKRLEADIRMHRETQQKTVDLTLSIEPGPIVDFSFEGFPVPGSVKEKVKKAWVNDVFETERLDDAVMAIRLALYQEGYLESKVTSTVEMQDEQKLVRFHIVPGVRYANVAVVFPGASEISAAELNKALDLAQLKLNIYADPQRVVDYLKRYYNERGYLGAHVDLPQPHLDAKAGTGRVSLQIQEGPLFTVGDLEFSGNSAFDYDQLWSVIPTSSGSIYDPNTMRDAVKALENLYHGKGYNDVTVTFRTVEDFKTTHANITFEIIERRQSIIRDIVIEGNRGTSHYFVRQQLEFQVGDVLDFGRITETRKRLYDIGVYSSVDFQTEEIPAAAPNAQTKDIRVRVRLREVRPYRLQYGFLYDTERGPGGLLEVQNLNMLGRASNLGLSLRYDSDLKEARVYYSQPYVAKIHLRLDTTAFVQRETRTAFSANRIGFSLFQERRLPRKYLLDYGYRYDHVRWNGLPPDPTIFQADTPVARLIATVTRDTRDSILDATKGEFTSHSFEFGPRWLGSETGFARYSGQYFRYVPLDKYLGWPRKDKKGQPIPARLVYAGALRLGLTTPFGGQSLISPERFFAGGGTTMRGFEQDLLGPTETLADGTVRPTGGEAMFLFNNEIRFPIIGILHGVGFLDIGNVYQRISDFNFSLRKSAGAGLRIKIKFIPLRFDYGFKLDRRPGESASAFFFSIGQAF